MKIVHYGYTFYPHYGGEENYIRDISKFLEKKNFEVIVVQRGFKEEYENDKKRKFSKRIKIKPVTCLAPKNPYTSSRLRILIDRHIIYPLVSFLALRKLAEKDDLIITHFPNLFFPSAWLLRKKCKTVCVSHCLIWDKPKSNFIEKIFYSFMKILHKIAEKYSNKIVANEKKYQKEIKSEYIPNYVDTKRFKPNKDKTKNNAVICVRNLYYRKGVDIAIRAFKDIDFELWVVGTGPSRKKLESIASKNIRFFGRVSDKTLLNLYQKAYAALVPSRYSEGTSLSALEAMACGLPTIVTNVGGLTDLVEDGKEGFVVNPNAKEIRDAIQKLSKNKNRERMGKAARIKAEDFSYERWCKRWLLLIDSLYKKS